MQCIIVTVLILEIGPCRLSTKKIELWHARKHNRNDATSLPRFMVYDGSLPSCFTALITCCTGALVAGSQQSMIAASTE